MAHPAQVEDPDLAFSVDHDGDTAQRPRNQLVDRLEAEGLILSACHLPAPGFGRVARREGRRYWRAL